MRSAPNRSCSIAMNHGETWRDSFQCPKSLMWYWSMEELLKEGEALFCNCDRGKKTLVSPVLRG
eukprot:31407-Eustigmatos_ZCMA.PRE.1